ncbi:MAG TPA: hypothetical protein VFV70_15480, partial [Hyphomonadaceae bacterium]|nr:hypothetical protein [Hyphomonadaceae bacterium]
EALSSTVFPVLTAEHFVRLDAVPMGFAEWTGGNRIVFQKRETIEWPTVEFELSKRGAGHCMVHLGVLTPECSSISGEQVPQDEAPVWMSPAYFMLSRDSKRGPSAQQFGMRRWLFLEMPFIEKDAARLKNLMQVVFEHFRRGLPPAWRNARKPGVHPNLTMLWGPWNPGRVNRSTPAGEYYRDIS